MRLLSFLLPLPPRLDRGASRRRRSVWRLRQRSRRMTLGPPYQVGGRGGRGEAAAARRRRARARQGDLLRRSGFAAASTLPARDGRPVGVGTRGVPPIKFDEFAARRTQGWARGNSGADAFIAVAERPLCEAQYPSWSPVRAPARHESITTSRNSLRVGGST